jgi:fatty-acyl-CoA synthase
MNAVSLGNGGNGGGFAQFPGDWTEGLARLFGARTAIVDEKSGARITYDALASGAAAAASALRELGVRADDAPAGVAASGASPVRPRVCVLAKNRVEHFEIMFACARLGALFVPLNWRLAEAELAQILDDAEPTVILADAGFFDLAKRLASSRSARALSLDDEWPHMMMAAMRTPPPAQAPVSENDPWIVLYTSGTTGLPKGALLPYRQVTANALNTIIALDLTSNDSTITYTPLFHTGGLHVLTTPLFVKGGTVVLADGAASFDAERFLALHAKEKCTLLFGVPTTFEMMASSRAFADVSAHGAMAHTRLALCGGAPCPLSLIERYTSRGIVFKQGYGLTEVGPNVLNLNAEDVVKKAGSAGRPNLFITARVVDENGNVVQKPGRGELCLGGPCVCLGYWNKPEATAAAFTKDGLFKTGDVVEIDRDGYMSIVDRKKDMFISGGENVYPAEVEKVLADHPAVRAAAVIGVADARWGEVGRAYVETREPVESGALLAFAKARLATYKVPKEIVVVAELPKNPSGKVQKHLLSKEVRT